MEYEFESLKSSQKTLQDDYEDLDQVEENFKGKANDMRVKVWKNVEEIEKLKRGIGNEGKRIANGEKNKWKAKQANAAKSKYANSKKRWNKSFNKQKKENWD